MFPPITLPPEKKFPKLQRSPVAGGSLSVFGIVPFGGAAVVDPAAVIEVEPMAVVPVGAAGAEVACESVVASLFECCIVVEAGANVGSVTLVGVWEVGFTVLLRNVGELAEVTNNFGSR